MRLRVGDKLRVWDPRGFWHCGIVLDGTPFGSVVIAHNRKSAGVERTTLEQFSQGRPVELESRVAGNARAQAEVVRRAIEHIGRGYDLLSFNCEHYVSYAQTGVASSPQLQLTVVAVLALIIGALVLSEA
jgi:hypothetical protein